MEVVEITYSKRIKRDAVAWRKHKANFGRILSGKDRQKSIQEDIKLFLEKYYGVSEQT